MLLERIETPGLSHYSYLVGCEGAGEVVVVDPRRDIDIYMRQAADLGVRITHIVETHIHADFASGAQALAAATGAPLMVSRFDADETYEVEHAHTDLDDGDVIDVGMVRLQALHTPGHTPEHMSYLVFDRARSETSPVAMFTGDCLFVGAAGRPDLLGEASAAPLASELYDSLRARIAGTPDHVEIYPAHGAGSMCGAGMSGRPMSTLGYERLANPYFQERSREAFIEWALANVPPFPPYYKRMKSLNSIGAVDATPILSRATAGALSPVEAKTIAEHGGVILDVRSPGEHAAGHPLGAISVGIADSFSVWAAWVVPEGVDVVLLVGDGSAVVSLAAVGLVRVGLDNIRGYIAGGFTAWTAAGLDIDETPEIAPVEARRLADEGACALLDVRSDGEWISGRAPDALHIHAGFVGDHVEDIVRLGKPVATICEAGYRAMVAASVLKRNGVSDVRVVEAGMQGWRLHDLPQETGESSPVSTG